MSFDENQHNRSSDGKFAEKVGTEPDDGFGAMLAETLRTVRERDQREADADASRKFCVECGDEVSVGDDGVAHHITEDGDIDYDKDAEHTAIDDSEYGDEVPVLFVTDDGYEVHPEDDQDAYAVYDKSGTYITTVTGVSDDHLSIEDELREKLAELEAADGR